MSMLNGTYSFANVAAGRYKLRFVAPSGFAFTLKDVGSDDTIDSDANTTTGDSDPFALPIGGTANIDAGIYLS